MTKPRDTLDKAALAKSMAAAADGSFSATCSCGPPWACRCTRSRGRRAGGAYGRAAGRGACDPLPDERTRAPDVSKRKRRNRLPSAARRYAAVDSPAFWLYTSGTTGDPKGVLYSHRSTVLHALGVPVSRPVVAETTALGAAMLGIGGLVLLLLPYLGNAGWQISPVSAPAARRDRSRSPR